MLEYWLFVLMTCVLGNNYVVDAVIAGSDAVYHPLSTFK